jgi:hypothetical protein
MMEDLSVVVVGFKPPRPKGVYKAVLGMHSLVYEAWQSRENKLWPGAFQPSCWLGQNKQGGERTQKRLLSGRGFDQEDTLCRVRAGLLQHENCRRFGGLGK